MCVQAKHDCRVFYGKAGGGVQDWEGGEMMRNYPPCPSCSEPELWVRAAGTSLTIACKECGWRHNVTLPIPIEEMAAAILQVVNEAVIDISSKSGHNV